MRGAACVNRIGAIALAGAIVAAPFLAWLLRVEAGLVVMAIGLGATSLLLRDALEAAPDRTRRWLRVVIVANGFLAFACLGAAGWLLVRG